MTGLLSLVPYDESCLEKSWAWLNDPEIRALTMTPEFSRDDQAIFFKSLQARAGYDVWGIALDDVVIGAAGLKNQREGIAEYWGYIGERALWGKGLGRRVIALIEQQAKRMGFHSLDLRVSTVNLRAIALYERTGFVVAQDASTDDVLYMVKRGI